jgi:hypothetical protein
VEHPIRLGEEEIMDWRTIGSKSEFASSSYDVNVTRVF